MQLAPHSLFVYFFVWLFSFLYFFFLCLVTLNINYRLHTKVRKYSGIGLTIKMLRKKTYNEL